MGGRGSKGGRRTHHTGGFIVVIEGFVVSLAHATSDDVARQTERRRHVEAARLGDDADTSTLAFALREVVGQCVRDGDMTLGICWPKVSRTRTYIP